MFANFVSNQAGWSSSGTCVLSSLLTYIF